MEEVFCKSKSSEVLAAKYTGDTEGLVWKLILYKVCD